MRHGDPLDSFEDALFRAARRERTQSEALERTADAVVASHRQRRAQRSAIALAGAMALAAGATLVLRAGPSGESIQAEPIVPRHSVSSGAMQPQVRERSAASAEPNPAASDDAAALRSGLASTTREEETVMLNGVRAELASGKAESALSLLDQYDRVSGGHLTAEATLLRIQALSRSGRASLAARLAQRFIDSDPNGPLAEPARAYVVKPPLAAHDERTREKP